MNVVWVELMSSFYIIVPYSSASCSVSVWPFFCHWTLLYKPFSSWLWSTDFAWETWRYLVCLKVNIVKRHIRIHTREAIQTSPMPEIIWMTMWEPKLKRSHTNCELCHKSFSSKHYYNVNVFVPCKKPRRETLREYINSSNILSQHEI